MVSFDRVWDRIVRHEGEEFRTTRGLLFTYLVPGNYLRIVRDSRQINRVLSRTNFERAVAQMPAERPSDVKERQGPTYTWAILMDDRIRDTDW